jgi:hypothetical protein
MSDMGFTPNFISSGNINPFRFVEINTSTAFTGQQANAASDNVLGVTDGSVRRFDATVHAAAGDPITLQPSNTVQVEAGAAISTIGSLLTSDSDGRAVSAGSSTVCYYMALETAGAAGEIIRAFRFGTRVTAP